MNDIEALQSLRNYHINDTAKGTRLSVVLTHAIEAIQEKAEREKGCEYCTGHVDSRKNLIRGDGFTVYIDGNNNLTVQDDSGFTYDIKINECPMCGRKLV